MLDEDWIAEGSDEGRWEKRNVADEV